VPGISGDARPGDLVRIRGERWRITRCLAYDTAALIETDGCDAANRGVRSRFLLPFEPVERIALSQTPRVVRPARWRRLARRTLGDATPGWTSLRAATRANLDIVPFQLEPALALVRGDGCRFLIADAVGLGKTVQAGLMIAELFQRQPDARALVVCPAGLREQWHGELQDRFRFSADVLDTAGVARATAVLPVGFNPWSAPRVAVTPKFPAAIPATCVAWNEFPASKASFERFGVPGAANDFATITLGVVKRVSPSGNPAG